MQHDRKAQAGARVRRAGSEVTEFVRVGQVQLVLHGHLDLAQAIEDLLQVKARGERGHAQVVFLVDHDRAIERRGGKDEPIRAAIALELVGNQVAFAHESARERIDAAEVKPRVRLERDAAIKGPRDLVSHEVELLLVCTESKWRTRHIARQAGAAGDHDCIKRGLFKQPGVDVIWELSAHRVPFGP